MQLAGNNEYSRIIDLVRTPPTVSSLNGATINEGSIYSENSSFTDPDSTNWSALVDYGDGAGAQILPLNGQNFSLSHVYKDNGTYAVTVSVTDNQGATGTGTATVTVNNVAPTPGAITISTPVLQVNNATTAQASFTDPGVLDTHTATWDWGDGTTPTNGTVVESNGSGTVGADSHTYTTAGVYTVTLTVTDKDGGVGTQTYQYVSVYNPTSQGLFSAGQRFNSPAGAYPQDSSLTGNVTFGLSYKYQGTVPTSNREFTMNFKAANNFTFNATTISSLVVANSMATLTGTGTINGGSQTYNFLVVGVNGGNIRVQITDPANNNAVIYDTQPGDPATATPTTSVTGNVIAHN